MLHKRYLACFFCMLLSFALPLFPGVGVANATSDYPTHRLVDNKEGQQTGNTHTKRTTTHANTAVKKLAQSASTPVLLPDLAMNQIDTSGDHLQVGQNIIYTLFVSSTMMTGYVGQYGTVHVTDVIPIGLSNISIAGQDWFISSASTISPLLFSATYIGHYPIAPGTNLSPIVVTGTLNSAAYPSLTTTALVAVPGDSNAYNNMSNVTVLVSATPVPTQIPTIPPTLMATSTVPVSATETVPPLPTILPDMSIQLSHGGTTLFHVGQGVISNVTARVSQSAGPVVNAYSIQIKLVIPVGMNVLALNTTNANWLITGSAAISPVIISAIYTGQYPVAPGTTLPPIIIAGILDQNVGPTFVETASVGTTGDSNPSNNLSNDVLFIAPDSIPTPTPTPTPSPTFTPIPTPTLSPTFTPIPTLIPTPIITPQANDWPTYHLNNARNGYQPNAIDPNQLTQAWTSSLDGAVYAEPLVVNNHVIVATENDSLYSLDPTTGSIVWRTNAGTAVEGHGSGCGDISPLGITGTPVYDPTSGLVFAVTTGTGYLHTLVGLDINTGAVRMQRNVDPANGNPNLFLQRGALALSQGMIYISYGGNSGDCGAYHGTIVATRTDGQGPLYSFQIVSRGGGMWAPSGPAVDSNGQVYVASGNSFFEGTPWDYSDGVLRLSPTLQIADAFAPSQWRSDNSADADLGSVGPLLLPNNQIFIAGKSKIGYLLNANTLGGVGGQLSFTQVCSSGRAFGGAAAVGAQILVPCTDGVRSFSITAGSQLSLNWHNSNIVLPPIVGGHTVYGLDKGNILYAVNLNTGILRTSLSLNSTLPHFVTPTISGTHIFVGTMQGIVAVNIS